MKKALFSFLIVSLGLGLWSFTQARINNAVGDVLLNISQTFTGNNTFSGLTRLAGFISTASSTVSAGGLNVQGNLSASSTLTVASQATLTGGFMSAASSSIGSTFNVTGQVNVTGTPHITAGLTGTSTMNLGTPGIGTGSRFCINIRNTAGTTSSMFVDGAGTALVVEPKACL